MQRFLISSLQFKIQFIFKLIGSRAGSLPYCFTTIEPTNHSHSKDNFRVRKHNSKKMKEYFWSHLHSKRLHSKLDATILETMHILPILGSLVVMSQYTKSISHKLPLSTLYNWFPKTKVTSISKSNPKSNT